METKFILLIVSLYLLLGIFSNVLIITFEFKHESYNSNYFKDNFIPICFIFLFSPFFFIYAIILYCNKYIFKKTFTRWLWEKFNEDFKEQNGIKENEMFTFIKKLAFFIFIIIIILLLFFPINVNAAEPPVIEIKTLYKEEQKSRTTQYEFTEEESLVLQKIAIAEAQSEGIGGMAFVMQTVLNRVESPDFPDTIYDVVSQNKQFTTFANGMYDNAQPTENSQKALDLLNILQNQGQLYFEVTCNNSWQSRNLTYVFTYENHTFYK